MHDPAREPTPVRTLRPRRFLDKVRTPWGGAVMALVVLALSTLVLAGRASAGGSMPSLAAVLVLAGLAATAIAYGGLVVLELWLLQLLPRPYQWAAAAAALVAAVILAFEGAPRAIWGLPILLAGVSLLGAGVAWIARPGSSDASRRSSFLAFAGAGAILVPLWAWLLWPGPRTKPVVASPAVEASSALPDPSRPGPYEVRRFTYGSGEDRRRPEYGARADWRAPSVDGSALLRNWTGLRARARARYWGFDSRRLPLQGRVFLPAGPGPFPLVVILHGQRSAETVSDRGFDYLATLLASRGAVAVSIDENFLNYSLVDVLGALSVDLSEDMDARAWLLLEHLRLWRGWSEEAGHPLGGRVDMSRIVLVGHSRGGEAAALAAVFDRLRAHPAHGSFAFDYGFAIRGIVALAPPDGSVLPGGLPIRLQDVDYLVVHGSKDGEVPSYAGSRQYERVRFTTRGPWFKAGVYVRGADHSQFNSDWDADFAFPARLLQSRRALLPRADQERIAKTFVSAFVEAVLHGKDEYRALFQDARTGASWLPPTDYLQQYADATTRVVADFEEDLDLATATLEGARISARGLTEWSEGRLTLRAFSSETRVAVLGWSRNPERPFYSVELPAAAAVPVPSRVTFHLADVRGERASPLDLEIEVQDRNGRSASRRLSSVGRLVPPIPTEVFKTDLLDRRSSSEPVLQHFEIPLEGFRGADPGFDWHSLARLRFVFDASEGGRVALDDVGLR
jgi:dienelactone hydrolase